MAVARVYGGAQRFLKARSSHFIGFDLQMDDDERAMIEEGNTAPGESAAQPTVPQEAQIRIEDDDDEPMRIVKDYQRPSARYCSSPLITYSHPHTANSVQP